MENKLFVLDDIYLVQMAKEDIPPLASAINDKSVSDNTSTIPYPYTLNDAQAFFSLAQNRKQEAGYHVDWLIKNSNQVIGGIGLLCQDGFHSHRTELGYWVAVDYRNQGIVSASLKTLIKYIFEHLHFVRLEANTYCDNIASQKVLEKNGFLREGLLRKYIKKGTQLKDVYCFSKLHPSID